MADVVLATKAAVVHLAGAETITGAKTFTGANTTFGNALKVTPVGADTVQFANGAGVGVAIRQVMPGADIGNANMGNAELVVFIDEAAGAIRFRYRTSSGVAKLASLLYANG